MIVKRVSDFGPYQCGISWKQRFIVATNQRLGTLPEGLMYLSGISRTRVSGKCVIERERGRVRE